MRSIFVVVAACLLALTNGQNVNQQQIDANNAQAAANLAVQQAAINAVNQQNAQQNQINAQLDAQNAATNAANAQQNVAAAQTQSAPASGTVAARYLVPTYRPTPSVAQSTYQTGYVQPAPRPTLPQQTYVQQGAAQGQAQGTQQAQVLSAVDASRLLIAAAIQQGANPNNFAIQTNARYNIAQQPNVQNPDVFTALDALRGRQDLTIDEILNILSNAVAGRDYPIYNDIPSTRFSCETVKQAGFYADPEGQCQVIRRCDINGAMWSYLCPNMTLFNQITLVCDWFFNVNCNNAIQYYDYSNPRLYTQFALLDTPRQQAVVRPGSAVGPVPYGQLTLVPTTVYTPVYPTQG